MAPFRVRVTGRLGFGSGFRVRGERGIVLASINGCLGSLNVTEATNGTTRSLAFRV